MKKRAFTLCTILALLLIAGLIFAYGATHWGWWLPCVFREITGFQCPGCGVTRMSLALLRLDVEGAFFWNPMVLCMLPIFGYLIGYLVYRFIGYGDMQLTKWQTVLCWILVIILLIFAIVRNFI